MTDPVATTGPRLKAERERRGLSSQKAADELHLDGWIIDALEAEDYLRIGPSVYAKGHLKRYAALLGLPAAEIMAGYESRAQAPKAPPSQPATVRLRTDAPAAGKLPWPRILSVAVLGVLIAGVFWWKPWHQHGTGPARGETLGDESGRGSRRQCDSGCRGGGCFRRRAALDLDLDAGRLAGRGHRHDAGQTVHGAAGPGRAGRIARDGCGGRGGPRTASLELFGRLVGGCARCGRPARIRGQWPSQ